MSARWVPVGRLLLGIAMAIVVLLGLGPTAASAAVAVVNGGTHAYDALAVAPADIHGLTAVRATQPQLIDQQKESVPPLPSAQGTATTRHARSVATEAVLVPGAGSGTRAINFKPNAADEAPRDR
jgi:hypothetical protein